jgi:hypothetical protein
MRRSGDQQKKQLMNKEGGKKRTYVGGAFMYCLNCSNMEPAMTLPKKTLTTTNT